jgi:hypothetical protein
MSIVWNVKAYVEIISVSDVIYLGQTQQKQQQNEKTDLITATVLV